MSMSKLISGAMRWSWLLFGVTLFGCSTLRGPIKGIEPTEQEKETYRQHLTGAWSAFESGSFDTALEAFQSFEKKYPQTIAGFEARTGRARSLEALGRVNEALELYLDLSSGRLSSQAEWSAQAFYFQAGVYETIGNETQMLASLLDADRRKEFLPIEIKEAALPARLATAYLKAGDYDLARKKQSEARIGIKKLRATGRAQEQIAKIYYEMGGLSTEQLSVENFEFNLEGLELVQEFLLGAIELDRPPWAEKALAAYQSHIGHFWNLAMNPPVSGALDYSAQARARTALSAKWVGELSAKIVQLRQLQRGAEDKVGMQEQLLNDFLSGVEKKIQEVLYSGAGTLSLTPESAGRELKKSGRVMSEPIFENEKKRPLQKPTSTHRDQADPNLKSEGDHDQR